MKKFHNIFKRQDPDANLAQILVLYIFSKIIGSPNPPNTWRYFFFKFFCSISWLIHQDTYFREYKDRSEQVLYNIFGHKKSHPCGWLKKRYGNGVNVLHS